MASINTHTSKDGKKTTHRVRIRVKGYPTITKTFSRITDARDWERSTEAAMKDGRYSCVAESKKHTVSELIEEYKKNMASRPRTLKDRTVHLDWLNKQAGHLLLCDFTPRIIAKLKNQLSTEPGIRKEKLSNGSVNRFLSTISHACTIACNEWGWLEENPCRKISKLKEPKGRVRFLSDEEKPRLMAACKVSALKALEVIVILAIYTGARKGEILGMTWKDIDWNNKRVTFPRTKNGEIRSVPLANSALIALKDWSKVRQIGAELVFHARDVTKKLDITSHWYKALETAQISDFKFHDLRHTAASYLAMSGASQIEITAILGHKTPSMAMRYAHLTESHNANVINRMANKFI